MGGRSFGSPLMSPVESAESELPGATFAFRVNVDVNWTTQPCPPVPPPEFPPPPPRPEPLLLGLLSTRLKGVSAPPHPPNKNKARRMPASPWKAKRFLFLIVSLPPILE